MHFQNNGRVAIVFNGHSFAKIVGGRHGKRDSLNRKSGARILHRSGDFAIVRQARRLPSATEAVALQKLQPRQVLRIDNSDRHICIIDYDEIIDPVAFEQVQDFYGQFVLMHCYRVERH